jgi:hypothetical protein
LTFDAVDSRVWRSDPTSSDSHGLTFMQQMRTERDYTITCREITVDRSRFIAESDEMHGTPSDVRRCPFDYPHAGSSTRVEDRSDWYLK